MVQEDSVEPHTLRDDPEIADNLFMDNLYIHMFK